LQLGEIEPLPTHHVEVVQVGAPGNDRQLSAGFSGWHPSCNTNDATKEFSNMIRKLFSVLVLTTLGSAAIACSAEPDTSGIEEAAQKTTDALALQAATKETPPRSSVTKIVSNEGPQAKPCSCDSYPASPGGVCDWCDMIDWNGDGVAACTCAYHKKQSGGSD
jgi:hypothetical protein